MRARWIVPVLLLGVGCQSTCRLPVSATECGPCPESLPCPQRAEAPCPPPPPRVEVRAPEEVHVKAPPQRIVVNTPAVAPQTMPAFAAVPQSVPTAPQMTGLAPALQVATPVRAVPAIGIDWVRIPVPIPRLFAVPAAQEITLPITSTQFFTTTAAAVQTVPQPILAAQPVVAAVPQAVPVAPAVAPVMALPSCNPSEAAARAQAVRQELEECQRRMQELERQIQAQKAAVPGK